MLEHCEIENLYYNGTLEQLDQLNIDSNLKYKKIIYQKNINKLLEDNYTFKQIDLITKGYQKGILLSNIDNTNENILRDIINRFKPTDIELYNILELLQKKRIVIRR